MNMSTWGVRSVVSIGYRRLALTAALLVVWVVLSGVSAGSPGSNHFRIAVLISRLTFNPVLEGLREGLARLGYREGENLTFLIEEVQGELANLGSRAAKLVEAKPDIIFTITTAPTIAAKQATTTIPIVFAVVGDPLRSGLIASYASSQNNLTGITNSAGPLSGKRLEILQEIAPAIKRVLVLVAPQESVSTASFEYLAEAAPKLGIELLRQDVSSKDEIEQILNAVPKGAVDAMYFVPSTLVGTHIALLIHKATEVRIPLAVSEYPMVELGALMSYGADLRLLGIQGARLVAKIMKGAKPSEIPVQMPEQLPLALNLATAKAIGLDIPRNILERTDRFVE
jgi:putative tryptophan/tyrosine transport system substrate-binding protein